MQLSQAREEALVAMALEKAADRRGPFLDAVCEGDPALRQRLEALLAARHQLETMLVVNPPGPPPTVTSEVTVDPAEDAVGITLGRYKILEKVGEGGCGVVYVAEQTEPVRRRVALKVIKLGMDTKAVVARFEAERQALAMMDHPNIAKVLDAGATDEGRPYFVMELVRGIRITDYCDQARLTTKERLGLFIKVCHAIQHAHQKGLIHRDIKPSNILVTLHDGLPAPKVIDFGIAKATEGRLTEATVYTQLHQFIGTPAYMSPEQAEMSGLDIDTRSDIYSLGVLLYELLTGMTPFDTNDLLAAGLDELRRTIREVEPMKPSTRLTRETAGVGSKKAGEKLDEEGASSRRLLQELIPALRGDLDSIVMKCLEKDRSRRYDTATGLAMDITRHLTNEPVVARPASAAYRFRKAWRRNKLAYSAAIAVGVALVGGVIGTSVGLLRAERERAKAEQAAVRANLSSAEAKTASALATTKAGELGTNLYFSRIALAHRELTALPANVKRAEELLDQCEPALRGWEWRYLKRLRFQELVVLRDPTNKLGRCVAFSPDGRLLALGGSAGGIRIWDLLEARWIQTYVGHTGFVAAVTFHPTNPRWLASVGSDNQLVMWDWQSGTKLHSWLTAIHLDYGLSQGLAFSPDGRRLAAAGTNSEMIVRELASGDPVLILSNHVEGARCVAFSPGASRWIATGGEQGGVHLWSATNGQLVQLLSSRGAPIGGLAFLQDPDRLVALQFDGYVRTWLLDPIQELPRYTVRDNGAATVGLVALSSHGPLATAGLDRLVTLSEPSGTRRILMFRELDGPCYGLAVSPDGNRFAAASRTGTVVIWDGTPLDGSEDRSLQTLRYSGGEVWTIDVAPDGRSIAFGGFKTSPGKPAPVQVSRIPGFQALRDLPGNRIVDFCLAYHPEGRLLACSGDEPPKPGFAKVKVWDLETQAEAFPFEAFQASERFQSVAFSHDGRWLVGGGNSSRLRVWSATTGRKVVTLGGHSNEIVKVAFSLHDRYLASMGNDDVLNLWDGLHLTEPQPSPQRFRGLCSGVADLLAFSPDEKRLAMMADDDTSVIHDLEGKDRALRLVSLGHRPLAVAFSPDGHTVASGGVDCTVRLWDADTGLLRTTLRSHAAVVGRLSFLKRPGTVWLISASRDGTVKFWDMARVNQEE